MQQKCVRLKCKWVGTYITYKILRFLCTNVCLSGGLLQKNSTWLNNQDVLQLSYGSSSKYRSTLLGLIS